VEIERAVVEDFRPRKGWNAWVVTNPPYGERLGDPATLTTLYRRLGEILMERCAGFHAAVLCGNHALARALSRRPDETRPMKNGPLDCELLILSIPR
jgi:23S rRNA (guanine2445-N2)-methyltransferase / 23S rRNA (guanine2069-N7)-methyltransferase